MPKQPRSIVLKSLSDLPPAPRNVKAHDLGAIISSVERFGFADAVVVDGRTGRLVSGHGRVEALLAMKRDGRPAPEGVQVKGDEWLVPVQTGWASRDDAEAEAFLVAANRLVELGGWDEANLAAVLGDLAKSGALDGTGYDGEDVDELLRLVAPASEAFPALPFGNRDPMRQMTFTLSAEQAELVKSAMNAAGGEPDASGNANRNGNALANVCRGFLASRSA